MLLLLILVAGLSMQNSNKTEPAAVEWKDKLAWAEGAVKRNDVFAALAVYDQVFREASIAEDWPSLLAVGCALVKLKRLRGSGLTAESALLRALAIATARGSPQGRRCAALGLQNLGDAKDAAAAASNIPRDRLAEQGESFPSCSCDRQPDHS